MFKGDLKVAIVTDECESIKAVLIAPFTYTSSTGALVYVPQGFRTDFASIPRAFWVVTPPLARHAKAAVVHDYLSVHQGPFTRKEVDDMFLEAMLELRVKKLLAYSMWLGVRIGSIVRGKK